MTDIVERLRFSAEHGYGLLWLNDAADEIERLCERIKELKPYEVVSGDTWKARIAYEELEAAGRMIKQLEVERDKLNGRIKGLQAKIKEYQAPTQSSPESEGVSG